MKDFHFEGALPESLHGRRLDQALAILCPEHSRSRLASWIKAGYVTRNGEVCPQIKIKVFEDDILVVCAEFEDAVSMAAEDIALDIIYEDESVLVINKPAGLVVHPAAGNRSGTLLNALLHHDPQLVKIPRAGIVHRLDKGTTGLMMVAKTLSAHTALAQQLLERSVKRIYHAVIYGHCRRLTGTVDMPLGRHPIYRTKMAVVKEGGKEARTHYTVIEPMLGTTLMKVQLDTGRTHQIRVHMAHVGYPLVGDDAYAGRKRYPSGISDAQRAIWDKFDRPALHAKELAFIHPDTGMEVELTSEYPEDFKGLVDSLKAPTEDLNSE